MLKTNYFFSSANKYKGYKPCCLEGTDSSPTLEKCSDRTKKLITDFKQCKIAFQECCRYAEDLRRQSTDVSLARSGTLWLLGSIFLQILNIVKLTCTTW